MKLTYLAILTSALAFTACDSGPDEEFGREVNDPRIETTNRDNFSGAQQSGAANQGTVSPAPNTGGANTVPREPYPTTQQNVPPASDGTVDTRIPQTN